MSDSSRTSVFAYPAVIFDLDGTLLYTLDDIRSSLNLALTEHGIDPVSLEDVRSRVGHGLKKLVEDSVPENLGVNKVQMLYESLADHYRKDPIGDSRPYEGIIPLLDRLKETGLAMAVLSNKDENLVEIICEQLFPGYFSVCAGKNIDPKVKRNPKPHRDGVDFVARKLGIQTSSILYVGDSEVDYKTAKNSGCAFCAVSWGYRDRGELVALEPDHLIDEPGSFLDVILK